MDEENKLTISQGQKLQKKRELLFKYKGIDSDIQDSQK